MSIAQLKAQHDIPQLNPIAIHEIAAVGNRGIVDTRLVGRSLLVDQDEAIALPLNESMVFFHPHVAEQRYVGTLITTKQVVRAQQGVLSALLPAPDNLDRGELKDTLHQSRQSTDAGTQNHQSQAFAPDIARGYRSFLQRLQQPIQAAA